jgi:hypothetical protein
MKENQVRLNDYEWLSIVPAGGLGSRLRNLTEKRAKPALAIAFEGQEILRMIDVPLRAVQALNGAAIVSRCFARETLDFVKQYEHVVTVTTCMEDSPIDTLLVHLPLIENSTAEHIGLIPGDTNISADTLREMRALLDAEPVDAVLLATRYLPGHNIRSVDGAGMLCATRNEVERIGDLGVHMFRRRWLLERLHDCLRRNPDEPREVWNDIYDVEEPKGRVLLYVPEEDLIDVDMGIPTSFQKTVREFNAGHQDANGNIVFPGASLHPDSVGCIALPNSISTTPLKQAIIPEGVTVAVSEDYLIA